MFRITLAGSLPGLLGRSENEASAPPKCGRRKQFCTGFGRIVVLLAQGCKRKWTVFPFFQKIRLDSPGFWLCSGYRFTRKRLPMAAAKSLSGVTKKRRGVRGSRYNPKPCWRRGDSLAARDELAARAGGGWVSAFARRCRRQPVVVLEWVLWPGNCALLGGE